MEENENLSQNSSPSTSLCLEKGKWVVVEYDQKRYPGEVTSVHRDSSSEQIEVSVMVQSFL